VASVLTDPPVPADHRIAYGEGALQFGELRLPRVTGRRPAVIAIHGGFWRAAYDLTHLSHLCAALTRAGFVTWSLEYPRIGQPGGGFPGTLQDVARGIGFLASLAKPYAIDLQRVVAIGHSAGGHLALWSAARSRFKGPLHIERDPVTLKGVVALAAVSDLAEGHALKLGDGAVGDFMGGGPRDFPDRYAIASPAALLPLGIKQILIHGTEDDVVPASMSVHYFEKASEAGDRVALTPLRGMGHFEPIDPDSPAWPEVLAAVKKLL
jgi:acetyl esterase/lipase